MWRSRNSYGDSSSVCCWTIILALKTACLRCSSGYFGTKLQCWGARNLSNALLWNSPNSLAIVSRVAREQERLLLNGLTMFIYIQSGRAGNKRRSGYRFIPTFIACNGNPQWSNPPDNQPSFGGKEVDILSSWSSQVHILHICPNHLVLQSEQSIQSPNESQRGASSCNNIAGDHWSGYELQAVL